MSGKPLLIILGPTAVGKTNLAIEIAQRLNGEIISADSRQIYRYMDIGTAKPTVSQRACVPHYLVDVVAPDTHLSLADYQHSALQAIDDIHARGKLPLLVGGTGQYITAIEEGWSIPQVPPNPILRTELEQFAQEHGTQALHTRLLELDPEFANRIHPNNVRRIVRALEVCIESGETMTKLQQKKPPPYRIRTVGLTMARENLYKRADQRVDMMLNDGFLNEVKSLLDKGYARRLPAMSGLGYLELVAHLLDDISLEEAISKTKFNTHDFIRRQEIWFRGHDNGIMWHNNEQLDVLALTQSIGDWLEE